MRRPPRKTRPSVATTEFALVVPLVMTIVLGCIDFGRVPYSYIAVTNAAYAGASFGSSHVSTTATHSLWQKLIDQAVTDELQGMPGFNPSSLTVTITEPVDSNGMSQVSVGVTYPFQTIVSWPAIPTTVRMRRIVVMRKINQ